MSKDGWWEKLSHVANHSYFCGSRETKWEECQMIGGRLCE